MNLFSNWLLTPTSSSFLARSARFLGRFSGGIALFCLLWAGMGATTSSPLAQTDPPVDGIQRQHTVQVGETLSQIAQTYDVSLADLLDANGIRDADNVRIGQTLRIPGASGQAIPTAGSAEGDAPPPPSPFSLNRRYTVQAGDTLLRIADRFGQDVATLMALNRMDADAASQLKVGQTLVLPATPDDLVFLPPDSTYVVQPGDSLGLIAQANGIDTAQLQQANGITDPNALRVGQELVIPSQPAAGADMPMGTIARGYDYHIVQPGETLSEIAQRFDTTVAALVSTNGLPDTESVYYGLYLRIPYGPPLLAQRRPPVPLSGTAFVVSISRQQCWVFRGDRVRHTWQCSTGHEEWVTRTGTFPVKTKMEVAQSSAYRLDMPYWLGLYDVNEFENGIHGIPVSWETGQKLWSGLVGQPATFGCAMLVDEDAERLFDLSFLGMPVHILD